jgi:DNA helicase II / ATP-dependent DNA helicase PcrA
MTTTTITPSPQQAAFFTWVAEGSGSCVLEAVAGAGKTTTLIGALALMRGDVFFGAYNKAIAEEIKGRVATIDAEAKIDVSTMHAAGFRFWRRVAQGVRIDGNKCRNLFRSHYETDEAHPELRKFESVVLALVSLGKQRGLGALVRADAEQWRALVDHHDLEAPDDDFNRVVHMAHTVLQLSTEQDSEVIDFDDMIYAPLFHKARVWQHDWVLIDEAQDTNATRRALALRMLKPGGRLIAVGDPHQAIYGFTGADSDALDLIARETQAVRLPLTITYRCPKAVVTYAQQWVQHITAADSAPAGSVRQGSIAKDLVASARPGDAVLCRFTAPLLTNVYAFIAKGIPAKVEGREIGAGLKALATRWKATTLAQLTTYLDAYCEREVAKLLEKEKTGKATALEDKVNCLRVIIERTRARDPKAAPADVLTEIDSIFGDDVKGVVRFSTIHKSKGREWPRVVWLDVGPARVRKEWELAQEANLCYVAATRAKDELIVLR